MEHVRDVLPVLLAALGASLLFLEVRKAQQIERLTIELERDRRELAEHQREMEELGEIAALQESSLREFAIRLHVHTSGLPREKVEPLYAGANEATLSAHAGKVASALAEDVHTVTKKLARKEKNIEAGASELERRTRPRTLRLRRWLLVTGFVLILLSSALDVAFDWRGRSGAEERKTPPRAFLWFHRTWTETDLRAFEREAYRHGHSRRTLSELYVEHPAVRHVLRIAARPPPAGTP